jgi:DNA-binding transcriptional LysR family regulator
MPLRFSLRQLEYFQAVAECGSIAAASERVNVSSPSISAAIVQLEDEFGLQLFVRKHAHGLSLTQGGIQFLVQARTVLSEAAKLSILANDITKKVRGPLNVGCLLTFAQILLPGLRRQFVDRHSDVEFHQFERTQNELIEGLRGAALDVALTYDLNSPADLIFEPLVTLPPYALVSEDHALARNESVTPGELVGFPMILLDLPMSAEYFLSIFDKIKKKPNIVERTRDMAVMQSLVANGFGYSLANIRPTSAQAPDGKKLRYIPLTGSVRAMNLGLLTGNNTKPTLTVKAFMEHCRKFITTASTLSIKLKQG